MCCRSDFSLRFSFRTKNLLWFEVQKQSCGVVSQRFKQEATQTESPSAARACFQRSEAFLCDLSIDVYRTSAFMRIFACCVVFTRFQIVKHNSTAWGTGGGNRNRWQEQRVRSAKIEAESVAKARNSKVWWVFSSKSELFHELLVCCYVDLVLTFWICTRLYRNSNVCVWMLSSTKKLATRKHYCHHDASRLSHTQTDTVHLATGTCLHILPNR